MSRQGLWIIALAGAALWACDSPSGPERAVLDAGAEPIALASFGKSPIVAKASGSAQRDALGQPAILNFSVTKRADGSVDGHYYFRALGTDPDQFIRVRVTCMTIVDGNKAWIGGIAEDAFQPALIGRVSYFYAFDNGEGANADGDVVSRVRAGDVDSALEEFCTDLPQVLTPFDVVRGNVNITE